MVWRFAMNNTKILIADDEAKMRELVRLYLEQENFVVHEAADGEEVLSLVKENSYQLLILDIMMPKLDGWSVVKEIRKNLDVPIIMLSARGEEFDRVLGFELGADDYVVKPFSPRELVARTKALLRRVTPNEPKHKVYKFGVVSIDESSRIVKVKEQNISNLTPKEFELLLFLAKNAGQVFTREQLLEKVWGYDFYGDLRTVDTHVKKLREKISKNTAAPDYIVTVWGVGYKFEVV